jgi:hypothetical protein
MSFVDRREQLLAEASRWVKDRTFKVKESTVGEEICH